MAISFACQCGEKLEVPELEAGRTVFCVKCAKEMAVPSASAPEKLRPDATPGRASETPPHCELIREPGGEEYWKLTCFCGKRVRSPASIDQPFGCCPKCGRRMKLPGYLSKKAFLISAHPGKGPVSAPSRIPSGALDRSTLSDAPIRISELFENREREDEHTTPLAPIRAASLSIPAEDDAAIPVLASDDGDSRKGVVIAHRVGHAAASIAADRLRPQHAEGSVNGRISAWPLAGKLSRALAAFIDITLTTALVGAVVILASQEILPAFFLRPEIVVAMLMLAGCLNDGLLHLIWGGSLGKKLVVIVTRTTQGRDLGAVHVLVRAALKWMLIPGWIIGAVDPSERTLHDLLCGTLVLKGRARHR